MAVDEASLRAAFDRVGSAIETTAVANPVNRWMRAASRRELLATFAAGSTLLEIGCGTGADAAFLAERGHRVAALDISDRMVELARERVARAGLGDAVLLRRGRIEEVAGDLRRSPWFPFDGVYANFSLTYEPSLREVAVAVHGLLRPGAWFVFTLPNRLCLSEPLLALARLRPGEALQRFREPRWATLRGSRIRFHVYTPAQVRRALEGLFEPGGTAGVPVFMPPPSFYDPAFERLRARLEPLDDRLSARFPWRLLGDTTLYKFRRVG